MAKFCTSCGSNIEEKPCGCIKEEKQVNENLPAGDVNNGDTISVNVDVNKMVNEGLTGVVATKNIITKMIKSPVSTFLDVIQSPNMKVGIIFILTHALLWGLIVLSFVKNIVSKTEGFLGMLLYELGLGEMLNYFTSIIPTQKVFLFTFSGIIVQGAVIIGLLVLVNSIEKGRASYQSIITMVGVSFAPKIIFTAFALVASFISYNLSVGLMIVGLLTSILLLFLGTKHTLSIDFDKAAYVVPLVYIVNTIIYYMYIKKGIVSTMTSIGSSLGNRLRPFW